MLVITRPCQHSLGSEFLASEPANFPPAQSSFMCQKTNTWVVFSHEIYCFLFLFLGFMAVKQKLLNRLIVFWEGRPSIWKIFCLLFAWDLPLCFRTKTVRRFSRQMILWWKPAICVFFSNLEMGLKPPEKRHAYWEEIDRQMGISCPFPLLFMNTSFGEICFVFGRGLCAKSCVKSCVPKFL